MLINVYEAHKALCLNKGRILFKVLTALPLKFKGFYDKNLKNQYDRSVKALIS